MPRWIPREERFFTLLGDLVSKVHAGSLEFVTLVGDYGRRHEHAGRIKEIEQACDDLVADLVARLNVSFITPLDRDDIYLLTTRCDDIIDGLNGLAKRMEVTNADPLRADVSEFAAILAESLAEVKAAFAQLETRSGVTEHAKRVRTLEKRGDVLYAEALHRLFTEEPNAIEVVKWTAIYERLEDALDRCKHLAELLESIVVKNA